MKIKRWVGLFVVLTAGSSVWGWSHWHEARSSRYQTASVVRGEIDSTVAATGTCNAVVTVQVGSQVSGNIKALYADFNTRVRKGQLVALIDPELFQAKVSQAQANLDNARASVVNARAVAVKARADIASAAASLENSKAQLVKARADLRDTDVKLQRRLSLFDQGVLAKEDTDTAQVNFDEASASVQAAEALVKSAEDGVKAEEAQEQVALAQVDSMAAQVRQLEAALAQAQLDLDHTEIRAPVDGTVIARQMDVGQTVAASFQAPTIFQIAQDLAQMQVDTNVDEADIGGVRLGQSASFSVDAFPGIKFPAAVSQIRKAPINQQNVITYDVVLSVNNTELRLLPGMTANVRILTNEVKDALKVPNAAFRFRMPELPPGMRDRSGTQTIYVLTPEGTPRPLQVVVGATDGAFTAVTSEDLRVGDLVLTGLTESAGATSQPSAARARGQRGPAF